MIGKATAAWTNSASRAYVATLIGTMSWSVALALALMICRSLTQGVQLLLVVPLMGQIGLDIGQGSTGRIADFVSSAFATAGITPTTATVLGAFVLFSIALALATRWQTTFNFKLRQDFVATLRRRLYRAIAETGWLDLSRRRSSDFTHALTTELDRVGEATAFLLELVTNAILVSVYILFALRLSTPMSVLAFFSGAGLLLLLRRRLRSVQRAGEDISRTTNSMYAASIEHLGGMKTIKSHGVEERDADIFSSLVEKVARAYIGANRNYAEAAFWFNVGSVVILSAILLVSLEALGISAATLLILLFLFNRMIPLFGSIQQSYQEYLSALPAFTGVMDLQAWCEAAAEPKADLSEKFELRRGIRLEGVSFAYGGGSETLAVTRLDSTIRAGETTAIVGPSGAGKSTIADLVTGLVTPDRGRVLVDGAPLDTGRSRSWRAQIGYVAQETFLFNDTVRANLLWARPEANDEEINRALRLAAAEEFVRKLPDGVDTSLGDRGVRLSGGERQRLALARALLREPSLLILDEATSALDSENEKRIQSAIEGLHGRTTILVITHRLSTVRRADIIHVLEHGHVVESGNWEALIDKGGRFSALARAQGLVNSGK